MSATGIGVGIVGLGFMGATHFKALERAADAGWQVRIAAVADADAVRRSGAGGVAGNVGDADGERLFEEGAIRGYATAEELFADPDVDAVSICTRTPTHVDLAIQALAAGKHVLVEKPVALSSGEVARLEEAAASGDRVCMPAMCMRFWPGWSWLFRTIADGTYGKVLSATFHRLGENPGWSQGFYGDAAQSGGALIDLHVHDADVIRWCFGDPAEVVTTGTANHLTTLYRFPDGPAHVVAEGAWGHSPGFPFRMRYVVVFEGATADFDLGRDEPLMLAREGRYEPVPIESGDGYDGEIRHFLDVLGGRAALGSTLADATAVTRILEAERRSLASGGAERP